VVAEIDNARRRRQLIASDPSVCTRQGTLAGDKRV